MRFPTSALSEPARYRAEHFNVANAEASTIDDDDEAHVAYEDGNQEDLTKEDLHEILEAYERSCLNKLLTELCLLSTTLKIG